MGDASGIYVRQMTSILLYRNDEILLLHRDGSRVIDDSWVGIGGHVENHESSHPQLGALRELNEEVGLRLDDGAPIPVTCTEGTLQWFSIHADLAGLRMPPTARIVLDHWLQFGRFDATTRYITLTATGELSMTGQAR